MTTPLAPVFPALPADVLGLSLGALEVGTLMASVYVPLVILHTSSLTWQQAVRRIFYPSLPLHCYVLEGPTLGESLCGIHVVSVAHHTPPYPHELKVNSSG
jgi:hypothetical protein